MTSEIKPQPRIVFCPKCGKKMVERFTKQEYGCPDGHKLSLAAVLMRHGL